MAAFISPGGAILPSLFCKTKQIQEGRGGKMTSSVKNPSASKKKNKRKKRKGKIENY